MPAAALGPGLSKAVSNVEVRARGSWGGASIPIRALFEADLSALCAMETRWRAADRRVSCSGSILVRMPICKAEGKEERSSLLPCFPVLPSHAQPC